MTENEYNDCVTQYADGVFRFIIKNIRHQADAEDIVQASFEKLWVNRNTVIAATSKSFLFTIAYNQMIDHIRKTKRITLQEDFSNAILTTYSETNQLKKALDTALAQLTEIQRSLVLLKDYEGYNYAEIGEITNLSESQVKVYLHRARLQLRDYIVKMDNLV